MDASLSPRILLIDDDLDTREVFSEFLRMHDLRVDHFETGEEAVAAARVEMPAVVLMDITLSGEIDGYEATRQIRALAAPARIAVVAMTGHSAKSVAGDLFDVVLTKPIDADAMVVLVQELLAKGE